MHAGLVRLLDLIRVNPQDTLLVDRFLILASDLEERSRVDATLGLSEALLRKNPRRAIELAHMVYKAQPGATQPIELMVEGLENLGRYGKATVLRAELEKVRKAQQAEPESSRNVTEASVMTIEKELKFLAGIEISPPANPQIDQHHEEIQKSVDLLPAQMSSDELHLQRKPPAPPIPAFNPLQYSAGPAFAEPAPEIASQNHQATNPTVIFDEDPQGAKPQLQEGLPSKLQRTSVSQFDADEPALKLGLNYRATQNSRAVPGRRGSHVAPGVPIFQDVPEVEDEESAVIEHQHRPEPVAMRPRVAAVPQAVPISYDDRTLIEQLVVERLDALLNAHQWDDAWELIQEHWPKADNQRVLSLFREKNLARIDFRFMGWWLDALVFDRRPRFALQLMIELLREQPHLSLAKMLIDRIQNTLKILGFHEVKWVESEGILALLRKLDLTKLQRPAAVAILRPRHRILR